MFLIRLSFNLWLQCPAVKLGALKVQMWLNIQDVLSAFLRSSRSKAEGCFLFNLPESNIQNSTYYAGTLRRLERLLLSKCCSSPPVATITCKINKCIFAWEGRNVASSNNCKIIRKIVRFLKMVLDPPARRIPVCSKQIICFHCLMTLMHFYDWE